MRQKRSRSSSMICNNLILLDPSKLLQQLQLSSSSNISNSFHCEYPLSLLGYHKHVLYIKSKASKGGKKPLSVLISPRPPDIQFSETRFFLSFRRRVTRCRSMPLSLSPLSCQPAATDHTVPSAAKCHPAKPVTRLASRRPSAGS